MSEKVKNYSFVLIAAFLSSVSLSLTRDIMIPFILAVFLAFILQPIIDIMETRLRIGRSPAIVLMCIFIITLSSLFFFTLGASFKQISSNASVYQDRITSLIESGMRLVARLNGDFDKGQLQQMIKSLPFYGFLKLCQMHFLKL